MKYEFRAKDQDGTVKEGTIEASNEQIAIQVLQKNNLVPIAVQQVKRTSDFVKELKRAWEGAKQEEIAIFFRQLATLIEAKVPITQSLNAIEEQTGNKFLKLVIREVSDDIQEGMTFSEALGKHPLVFKPLVANIIRAGEISGNLQQAVSFVADSIEKNNQLSSKIKSALYYPSFVVIVASIIGFLVITIVLPKLTGIIRSMNIPLPWYTKLIMWFGDFMASFWWAVLIIILGIIGGILYYVKTEAGKREWDNIKIKIPVVGGLFRAICLARFADNLSLMIMAGIPIVRALMISSEVVSNSLYESVILRAADEVKTGGRISVVFFKSAVIPPIVSQMVKIGEETGKLGEVLVSITRFYEQEIDKTTRDITTLIEPVMIIILGIGVAIMVFGILIPIYDIAGKM